MENNESPFSAPESPHQGWFERLAGGMDASRRLISNFGKLAFVMSKGAYLVEERRKLYEELGQRCLALHQQGKISDESLEVTVRQIEKLTKKIEIEEILIRQFRFGYRPRRTPKETANV